jgi:hypothetical protein
MASIFESEVFKSISAPVNKALINLFDLDKIQVGTSWDRKKVIDVTPENIDQVIGSAILDSGMTASYAQAYANYVKTEVERKRLYKEYDRMDDESEVITTALDVYTDDATDFDTFVGSRVWVTSNDEHRAGEMNAFLKRLKIDKILPRIARNLSKYGDFPLKNEVAVGEKRKTTGIERIDTSYHPRDVMPVVKDNKLLGYWVTDESADLSTVQDNKLFAPWDFVWFAIPGDSNFISFSDIERRDTILKRGCVPEYGQSLLKASRKPFRRSKLMHDILAITRMTRSPLKRVFKFKTNTGSPVQAIAELAIFKKTMEKIGGIDKANDDMNYDELMNIITQDIYIPIMKDDKGDYSFDTVGGDVDVANIVDVELFDNRLYMSLRIPKEFLNFGDAFGDKATLLLKDVRYAKRIRRLQNALKAGIRELLFIQWAHMGKTLTEDDFEVCMTSTSISDDLQRLDYLGAAVSAADTLIRMLSSFGELEVTSAGASSAAAQLPSETDIPSETDLPSEAPIGSTEKEPDKKTEGTTVQRPVAIDKGYLVYYVLKDVVKLQSFNIEKFYPAARKYIDQEQHSSDVDKEKDETTKKLVENNLPLLKRLVSEKFDKNDLREAVEVGLDLEKEYHSSGIPNDLQFDHKGLTELCEGWIKEKDREIIARKKEGGHVNF